MDNDEFIKCCDEYAARHVARRSLGISELPDDCLNDSYSLGNTEYPALHTLDTVQH